LPAVGLLVDSFAPFRSGPRLWLHARFRGDLRVQERTRNVARQCC
jgi:hypothetical protein